ncbi:MAG: hypothetical protein HOM84_06450 [Thiotrichales bacterium]|jgi:plasmid stability protein|nr:hypothetical protein [Thiotrichales bacterium]MBT3613450.1 hypothetical protein [Thiotrichales bacterium]MBT3753323.1 hypothetical protein [Thiotrichales bacterium]MBT3836963.1 hypothetical protein [Thiotrichales bacterium]MBT4262329.1 hypothetical protein [Thiotrichales bacterium]
MSSLQVRELPENIYYQLKKTAEQDHRSLAQQAVAILAKGLKVSSSPKERRLALLQQITQEPVFDSETFDATPQALIREDRDR